MLYLRIPIARAQIMEQEIYNKQITELLRKKKILIEKLNELLRQVNERRPGAGNTGNADLPGRGDSSPGNHRPA